MLFLVCMLCPVLFVVQTMYSIASCKYALENTEGATKNEQSRETGNIGNTRQRKTKHNTTCAGNNYAQTNKHK